MFASHLGTRAPPVAPRAILGAMLALGACAGAREAPDPVREPTRTPTVYHAMSRPEIQRHMHALAEELLTLTGLTARASPADDARRAEVLASLERIATRARQVGGDGAVTNYSVVNDYMDGFLEDVATSDAFARREPPNLVPANRLVQSCLACHQSL